MPTKNKNMALVKGQNLRVLLGGETIASALSCTMNVKLNVIQAATKDDEGCFDVNMPANLEWSVKSSAVVTDETGRPNAPTITSMIGATVMISFSRVSTADNITEEATCYAGLAKISDVNITAQNRQRTTYEVTFTGQRNMLQDIRTLVTADNHALETASGHTLAAAHEEV